MKRDARFHHQIKTSQRRLMIKMNRKRKVKLRIKDLSQIQGGMRVLTEVMGHLIYMKDMIR